MEPGNRNAGLFDELRAWAYRQPKAGAYPQWLRRCVDRALAMRRTMPDLQGFPEREAIDTAQSVAAWTWERPTAGYDPHYRAKQSSRGFSQPSNAVRPTNPGIHGSQPCTRAATASTR